MRQQVPVKPSGKPEIPTLLLSQCAKRYPGDDQAKREAVASYRYLRAQGYPERMAIRDALELADIVRDPLAFVD